MKLFERGKIGELVVKNRVVMAPMGMGPLVDSHSRFSQRLIDHYVAAAKGGTGLIITGLCRVSRQVESMMASILPTINDHIHVERLSELADAIHDYGARIAIQLTAGFGRVAPEHFLKGNNPIAPSPLPYYYNSKIMTHELSQEDIEQLVQDFEFASKLLQIAGIDAVELHAHEGYLWDQFQTELWNKRTDKYGGNLDNRLRFTIEVIEAIKRGAGADFPIIFRFGLKHCLEGGREVEEGLEIARRVEVAGVDALEVDAGCYETWYWAHPTSYQSPGLMIDMASLAKDVVNIPVIAIGKLNYPELAESVLKEGKADFVALGRALLADPEWANKVKAGRLEDIRPCIGDNEGCLGRLFESKYTSCTVNPTVGMERELALRPPQKKKSVLVVGGGPGGMEAARVTALRGHAVTLWEKKSVLGGNLLPASVPEFKKDYRDLVNYLITQITKIGVAIELGMEATPELIEEVKPEVVFLATGAGPIFPDIPGIENGNSVTAADVLLAVEKVGNSVIVVGGGLIGCETALYLAQKGKKVAIVEALEDLANDTFRSNRMFLLEMMADERIDILTETKVVDIKNNGILIADKNDLRRIIKADTIVLAVGYQSNRVLLEELEDKVPEVYAIGDCVKPRKVKNAIWEAYRTARLV